MKLLKGEDVQGGRELLAQVASLLAWEGRHLVRWVSSILCGDSKLLERRQKTLEALLAEVTAGVVSTYEDLGILAVPPDVTFHGPARMRIGDECRDFQCFHGPTTLSLAAVQRIAASEP